MVNLNMLGGIGDYFSLWQVIPLAALIVVLIFWKKYRDKQI